MAIRICPECGKKVTDKRKDCPHCNYQFPETKMCPECGEEVDLNLLECPECGCVFESLNTEEVNENVTNNSTASINDCGLGISSSTKRIKKNLGNNGALSGKHKRKQMKNKKKLLTIILILIGSLALSIGGYFGIKEIIKHKELGEMLVISKNEESVEIIDFNDSIAEKYNITEITIPKEVTSIGSYAFENSKLEKIKFDDNSQLTSIGESAFEGCSFLESIVIPNSLTSIGNYAFSYCKSLKAVAFEDISQLASIGKYSFNNCSLLESIIIPNSVTSIGEYAFYNCFSLESIVIPNSVTSIGFSAFELEEEHYTILEKVYYKGTIEDWCNIEFTDFHSNPMCYAEHLYMLDENKEWYEVTEIILPNTVTSIGDYQFCGFDKVTSIYIPDSVTSIGFGAFSGWSSLEIITIPSLVLSDIYFGYIFGAPLYYESDVYVPSSLKEVIITGVTNIGYGVFYYCTFIESITIPNSVTSIGQYAFSNCTSLESIVIPNSVTSIGEYAFITCTSLEKIYYKGTIEEWCKISFENEFSNPMYNAEHFYMLDENNEWYEVTEIIIPNTVTSIGDYQFCGFDNVTSIYIQDGVTSIGRYSFKYCTSLESIVIPNSVTSIGEYAFNVCSSLTIYCDANFEPIGWDFNWNYDNRPVYWYWEWVYDKNGNPYPIFG